MRRAPSLSLRIEPAEAFDALCALESREDLSDAEIALLAALRVALRPGLRVALRVVQALGEDA